MNARNLRWSSAELRRYGRLRNLAEQTGLRLSKRGDRYILIGPSKRPVALRFDPVTDQVIDVEKLSRHERVAALAGEKKARSRRAERVRRMLVEYRSYNGAKQRCENPKNPAFAYYGGRGGSSIHRFRNFSPI
jgi:hypothetical protein